MNRLKPEEQAKVLFNEYLDLFANLSKTVKQIKAKEAAIKTCEKIIAENKFIFLNWGLGFVANAEAKNDFTKHSLYKYWIEVIQEIKKI